MAYKGREPNDFEREVLSAYGKEYMKEHPEAFKLNAGDTLEEIPRKVADPVLATGSKMSMDVDGDNVVITPWVEPEDEHRIRQALAKYGAAAGRKGAREVEAFAKDIMVNKPMQKIGSMLESFNPINIVQRTQQHAR